MRLATLATIIIEMDNPEAYGYSEPTMKGLLEMMRRGECEFDMPELFDHPVYIFKQKVKISNS